MPFQEVTHAELTAALAPKSNLARCAILFHWKDCTPCQRTLPEFEKAGAGLANVQCFAIERDEARKGSPDSLLKQFGLAKPTWPTILWWDKYDTKCYPFPQGTPRTAAFLTAWMEEGEAASEKAHEAAAQPASAAASSSGGKDI
jgi:hypothetical protein